MRIKLVFLNPSSSTRTLVHLHLFFFFVAGMAFHSSPDMHQRPLLTLRSSSSSAVSSRTSTPRLSPLLPSTSPNYQDKFPLAVSGALSNLDNQSQPTVCGLPLKYLSYVICHTLLVGILLNVNHPSV